MFSESYVIKDTHSEFGVGISLVCAMIVIFLISDPFKGLILSQMLLSIQLPFTIFLQVYLTYSEKVMGKYKNTLFSNSILLSFGLIVTILNIALFISMLKF